MPSETNNQSKIKDITIVNVAVAVIHYENKYLLGFRDAAQHQGNRYEFVGGKIETEESAEQALIREVVEETGISIAQNVIVKLGRLHHDYGDKQVSLEVYKIELTAQQYEQHKDCEYGLEGQAMTWVDKFKLLAGEYHLPAANKTILEWLKLPAKIAITYPLAHFSVQPNSAAAWVHYHRKQLAPESWVYIRLKASESEYIAEQLMDVRPDILAILPYDNDCQHSKTTSTGAMIEEKTNRPIVARHLTHSVLMEWFNVTQDITESEQLLYISNEHPLIVSCHDIASILAANKLASMRIQQQLPPVIGAFLSPVLTTQTHPDTVPLGWEAWSALAQLADMPVIGLGGLAPVMIDQTLAHGGVSVAGIRQFHE
ncbi:NUDIX domain-containing protein [Psychrobacter sp. T6-5]|uniref:NUDIX domain-containing protein n=1 Tax=Psychrobacter sp. T6-5 TaxID=3457451 RepID=UPI003FD04668